MSGVRRADNALSGQRHRAKHFLDVAMQMRYHLLVTYVVGMAQLASAPDCGSGGRGFESHYPPF